MSRTGSAGMCARLVAASVVALAVSCAACGVEQGDVDANPVAAELGEVRGVVRDTLTAQPIAGAQLRVEGREERVLSDVSGQFSLRALVGTVTLSVVEAAHLTLERRALVVRSGAPTNTELTMFPTAPSDAAIDAHLARLEAGRVLRDDPSDLALRPEARAMILGERAFPEVGGGGEVDGARGEIGGARAALDAPPATIRIWRRSIDGATASCSGRIDVIPFEEYVKGVLPHEWIASWRAESLRAGSLAVRTYSWRWINAGGKYDCADLDDTTRSQVYRDDRLAVTSTAVDATRAQGIVAGTALVSGEYSAENGSPTALGVSDALCVGRALAGHGRGMCQWGSQRWALDGQSHEWIATHYYPGSAIAGGAPAGPAYDAAFVGESHAAEMVSGERVVAWVELRNAGSTAWDVGNTRVGTTGPRDRASQLFDAENWINPTRASGADHAYATGATGRFTFMITAPEVTTDTVLTETFGLVQEGVTWFGPEDVTISVTVHPRAGTAPTTPVTPGATDLDGDGSPAGTDCDDNDAARSPSTIEICGNMRDEDCSGADLPCTAYVPDGGAGSDGASSSPLLADARPRAGDVDGCSVARPGSARSSTANGAAQMFALVTLALFVVGRRRAR